MRPIASVMLVAAVYGCGRETEVPRTLGPDALSTAATVSYTVVKYPASLGGTQSRGMAINSQGLVAGFSNLADNTRQAALWRNGVITGLGTLAGPGFSSTVPWPGLNEAGMVVGITHTTAVDPLDEDWSCELGGFLPQTTNRICRGFFWENGVMHELPTLGGNHGFAAGVNNLGQIVGWSETAVDDPTCTEEVGIRQFLQFRATLWEPKSGSKGKIKTRQLRPLGNDSTSAATAINDNGQVVGISGRCDQAVGRFSALHAVLWDKNGKPTEIPNLGGVTWHTPMDINAQGDVAGFSNPPGPGDPEGDFIANAFVWINGSSKATNIGTLDDDPLSQAAAINSRRQVVGISFGDLVRGPRAFLWQNDVLVNLNDLVDIGEDVLLSAQDINDAGQITGRVRDAATGQVMVFVATPITSTP